MWCDDTGDDARRDTREEGIVAEEGRTWRIEIPEDLYLELEEMADVAKVTIPDMVRRCVDSLNDRPAADRVTLSRREMDEEARRHMH